MADDKKRSRPSALEAAVVIPNVILLAVVVIYVVTRSSPRAEPLVQTDRTTASRIDELEEALKRDPRTAGNAIELARLYSRAGEFPWSVDALRTAERTGDSSLPFRMKLGLAYLELGKNLDGLRVLKAGLQSCSRTECPADLKARLEIFTTVAELLVQRRIDARNNQVAAAKVFQEVLKPVKLSERPVKPPARPVEQPPAKGAALPAATDARPALSRD